MKIEDIFEGLELSLETKNKVSESFDLAVQEKVNESINEKVQKQIEEGIEKGTEEKIKELEEKSQQYVESVLVPELNEKVDQYLSYTTQNWLKENKLVAESSMKVELAESVFKNLSNVFENHSIVPPESKDLMAEHAEQLNNTKQTLDEKTTECMTLNKQLVESQRELAFIKSTASLTESQREEIRESVEDFSFDDNFSSNVIELVESKFKDQDAEKNVDNLDEKVKEEENPKQSINESDDWTKGILSSL